MRLNSIADGNNDPFLKLWLNVPTATISSKPNIPKILSGVVAEVIENNGLGNVKFRAIDFRAGGMYGNMVVHISTNLIKSAHKCFYVIMHELGHAYRDINDGPIYNYYLCKSTAGEDISVEEASRAIAIEERKACDWATAELVKYGIKNPIVNTAQPESVYASYIAAVKDSGVTDIEGLVNLFLKIGGYAG